MNGKKIYIVNGHKTEVGYESTWIEEIFEDEEQAKACCKLIELSGYSINNAKYYISEHEICTHDYIEELEDRKRWVQELKEYEERIYRGEI